MEVVQLVGAMSTVGVAAAAKGSPAAAEGAGTSELVAAAEKAADRGCPVGVVVVVLVLPLAEARGEHE